MRIAYLSQSYPPMVSGASLAVQILAEGMAQRGHQVLILTSSDMAEPYTQQIGTLKIYHNRSYLNPFRVGQRFTGRPDHKSTKLLYDFKPDIIHVHDPFQFAHTGLKYCQKKRIPITITTHQLPWFVKAYLPRWFKSRNLIEKCLWSYGNWLLLKFDLVISPTNTIAKVIYNQTGIASSVVNYGIELDCFNNKPNNEIVNRTLRRKFNIPPNVPIMLHIGRLDIDKSVDIVVRAAAKSMSCNDAHLLIVGDGTEKNKLMRLCQELNISERSHFPGYIISRQSLAEVYRIATVFVTASEIETQGIVLVEAAACGLPIVAVNATCIPEIVKEGENGYLTPIKDIDAMANRLSKLLANREDAGRMGHAGSLISKKFSKRRTVDEHADLYARLLLYFEYCSVSSPGSRQKLRTPFV